MHEPNQDTLWFDKKKNYFVHMSSSIGRAFKEERGSSKNNLLYYKRVLSCQINKYDFFYNNKYDILISFVQFKFNLCDKNR